MSEKGAGTDSTPKLTVEFCFGAVDAAKLDLEETGEFPAVIVLESSDGHIAEIVLPDLPNSDARKRFLYRTGANFKGSPFTIARLLFISDAYMRILPKGEDDISQVGSLADDPLAVEALTATLESPEGTLGMWVCPYERDVSLEEGTSIKWLEETFSEGQIDPSSTPAAFFAGQAGKELVLAHQS